MQVRFHILYMNIQYDLYQLALQTKGCLLCFIKSIIVYKGVLNLDAKLKVYALDDPKN